MSHLSKPTSALHFYKYQTLPFIFHPKTVRDHPRERERGERGVIGNFQVETSGKNACCMETSVCECVAISRLDWGKPNSPMMYVDHGVRLGEAQFSSGGVTYLPRHVT
ncbi:unnamed protein product [Brassica oleracea var. botrytis]|uniref:Uncharacterized protein n=1 Tax=Brassica oleracea TaxID=3712 RepID=A0A3P6AVV5_BRAOL|nr:unnamed protein product [Brassica oleracea]